MIKKRIPLTVIGGYLGAGKTTLLNHILRHNQGRRLAVIVNDFGNINIDADLIQSQDEEVINLANGCICCSLTDGFAATLTNLLNLPRPPDHVVIEASGVADPNKLGQYGHYPGFRLEGVIVLADTELVRQKAGDKYVGDTVVRQLQGANLIVLNKIDLLADEALQSVVAWLNELVPGARIIKASHGRVSLPLLLGQEAGDATALRSSQSMPDGGQHHPESEYETWSFFNDRPINGEAFKRMVNELPASILRAKGILYLQQDPHRRHIFQLVGRRWSVKAGEAWGDALPASKVVMIGLPGALNGEQFRKDAESLTRIPSGS